MKWDWNQWIREETMLYIERKTPKRVEQNQLGDEVSLKKKVTRNVNC